MRCVVHEDRSRITVSGRRVSGHDRSPIAALAPASSSVFGRWHGWRGRPRRTSLCPPWPPERATSSYPRASDASTRGETATVQGTESTSSLETSTTPLRPDVSASAHAQRKAHVVFAAEPSPNASSGEDAAPPSRKRRREDEDQDRRAEADGSVPQDGTSRHVVARRRLDMGATQRPPRVHRIPLKGVYLAHVLSGRKTVEGRLNKGMFRHVRAGDRICFFCQGRSAEVCSEGIHWLER